MAKIVVTFNGLIQQELPVNKARLSIGRRPGNDLLIEHLTVSGKHAAIETTAAGSFIVDLGSTNGTLVNGQPVKKHLLQANDVIEIGKYKLKFVAESARASMPAGTPAAPTAETMPAAEPVHPKIKVLSGKNAGQHLVLYKAVTTIGSPGVQVVAITTQHGNFFVAYVEGQLPAKLNGRELGANSHLLANGDIIDLIGTRLEFVAG